MAAPRRMNEYTVRAMRESGIATKEIAARYGVTPDAVYLVLNKGYKNGKPGAKRAFDWKVAQFLRNRGHSLSEIARELGVSRSAVSKVTLPPAGTRGLTRHQKAALEREKQRRATRFNVEADRRAEMIELTEVSIVNAAKLGHLERA